MGARVLKAFSVLLFTATLVMVAPGAHASPPDQPGIPLGVGPAPPRNFTATYDPQNHTVQLTWSPFDNATYNYTLYRNGQFIDTTTATNYTDLAPASTNAYQLVATDKQGQSSSTIAIGGPVIFRCPIIRSSIETQFPFVFFHIADECLPQNVPDPGNIVACRFGWWCL